MKGLLSAAQIDALLERRDRLLERVERVRPTLTEPIG
jgi:hypothetical protein